MVQLVNKNLDVVIFFNVNIVIRTIIISYFFFFCSERGTKLCPINEDKNQIDNVTIYLMYQDVIFIFQNVTFVSVFNYIVLKVNYFWDIIFFEKIVQIKNSKF